jgi:hypothetical protein
LYGGWAKRPPVMQRRLGWRRGPVAQLVECTPRTGEVRGSTPLRSTSSLDRSSILIHVRDVTAGQSMLCRRPVSEYRQRATTATHRAAVRFGGASRVRPPIAGRWQPSLAKQQGVRPQAGPPTSGARPTDFGRAQASYARLTSTKTSDLMPWRPSTGATRRGRPSGRPDRAPGTRYRIQPPDP